MSKGLAFLSLMLSLCLSVTAYSQTAKIAGKVTDAESQAPLPGVNVFIEGTTMGAATDADGDYFIINVPHGTYTIVATMMGYVTVNKTDVLVSVGRTIRVDFEMQPTVLMGEEVTIVAEREVVQMDISASHIVAEEDEIVQVPTVTDIQDFINLQVGVENQMIRGGGLDQTGVMIDGLLVVDNLENRPAMLVNLSSIAELNIIKGGFNAEYGNIRSGLINIVTKEGTRDYHGSLDLRISPAHLKHSGSSITSLNSYYLRPYFDPGVAFVGTQNGTWDEATQAQNLVWMGWNAYSEKVLSDDDPDNDMTPQEAQDWFRWLHAAEGSDKFGQEVNEYSHLPHWIGDVSFGGPVPLVGKYLGDLSFFASHRENWETFGLPTSRDYYRERSSQLKLTNRISPSVKVSMEAIYGVVNSVSDQVAWGKGLPLRGGDDIFSTRLATSWGNRAENNLFWFGSLLPFDVFSLQ